MEVAYSFLVTGEPIVKNINIFMPSIDSYSLAGSRVGHTPKPHIQIHQSQNGKKFHFSERTGGIVQKNQSPHKISSGVLNAIDQETCLYF